MVLIKGKVVKHAGELCIDITYSDAEKLGWKPGDTVVVSIVDVERAKK